MPIYDFKCDPCNSIVEIKTVFGDEIPKLCINCSAEMTRQISIPAIQFKGSGFYSTDNRKK